MVREVFQVLKPKVLPPEYLTWTSWKKFLYEAKVGGFTATAIREPKGTRASKSKYWKICRAMGINPPRKAAPKPKPKLKVYRNRIFGGLDAPFANVNEAQEAVWNMDQPIEIAVGGRR